jgi:predicted transcriptional regulator
MQDSKRIENKIREKYGAFGELKVIEQESVAGESSQGGISTFSTKHQKKMIEQQLYDLISDTSRAVI